VITTSAYGASCVYATDLDNDGDLDLGIARDGPNRLFFNNLDNANHYIKIKLTGVVANKNGIGSLVRVKSTISGQPTWQMRDISGQTGFASQNSLIAHFGLGDATQIDSIIIDWAGSETRDILLNVPVDQLIEVTEQQTSSLSQAGQHYPGTFMLHQNYPNPFNPRTTIAFNVTGRERGIIKIFDALGQSLQIHQIEPGQRSIQFDGHELSSGIYYYQITAGSWTKVRKMVLIK